MIGLYNAEWMSLWYRDTFFMYYTLWNEGGFFCLLKDYSKFLDDNFDAKEWVNTAFRSQKDPSAAKDVS